MRSHDLSSNQTRLAALNGTNTARNGARGDLTPIGSLLTRVALTAAHNREPVTASVAVPTFAPVQNSSLVRPAPRSQAQFDTRPDTNYDSLAPQTPSHTQQQDSEALDAGSIRDTKPAHSTTSESPLGAEIDSTGTTGTASDQQQTTRTNRFSVVKLLVGVLLSLSLLTAMAFGWSSMKTLFTHEETDDAYTTAHQHRVSARVNGTIEQVLVDDNEHVKKGQVLVALDPRDYQVRVEQAKAALELARHQAEAANASIELASTDATGKSTEAEASVQDAEAAVKKSEAALLEAKDAIPRAQADLRAKQAEETRAIADERRFTVLAQQGAVSYQQRDAAVRDQQVATSSRESAEEQLKQTEARLEQARHAVSSAKAQLNQSKGQVEQAQSRHVQTRVNAYQYKVARASVSQAEAQLRDAELSLSYTKIVAPIDGRVGKKEAEAGQRVQPGQQLMTVVADDVWVVANFKETQLERMRPEQTVEIKIDSFPHHSFTGTVDSISPGSGASFALLPSDNATGNFTKIVQRVPVKILFEKQSTRGFENLLVPGMSAVVTVNVGQRSDSSGTKVASTKANFSWQTRN